MAKRVQIRSDLEKLMRKANDRLRALEKAGEISSPAYQSALRTMRLETGNAALERPRFTREAFRTPSGFTKESQKQLTKVLKGFLGTSTSTVSGVHHMEEETRKTIEKKHGIQITKDEAKRIGRIWEAVRSGGSYRYDASADTETQRLIVKGVQSGMYNDEIAGLIRDLRDSEVPLDQWESMFDQFMEGLDQEDADIREYAGEALYNDEFKK